MGPKIKAKHEVQHDCANFPKIYEPEVWHVASSVLGPTNIRRQHTKFSPQSDMATATYASSDNKKNMMNSSVSHGCCCLNFYDVVRLSASHPPPPFSSRIRHDVTSFRLYPLSSSDLPSCSHSIAMYSRHAKHSHLSVHCFAFYAVPLIFLMSLSTKQKF